MPFVASEKAACNLISCIVGIVGLSKIVLPQHCQTHYGQFKHMIKIQQSHRYSTHSSSFSCAGMRCKNQLSVPFRTRLFTWFG